MAILAALVGTQLAAAEDGANQDRSCGSQSRCARCGQEGACQLAVCRIVCETTKIKKPSFHVETEQFCTANPQCPCHGLLGCPCGKCDASEACKSREGCRSWLDRLVALGHEKCIVPPTCGPVRCRKKLVVKEEECEVPAYKCKVEYLCSSCCSACGAAPLEGPSKPMDAAPQPAPLPPTRSAQSDRRS
jgi:hypothetical protein